MRNAGLQEVKCDCGLWRDLKRVKYLKSHFFKICKNTEKFQEVNIGLNYYYQTSWLVPQQESFCLMLLAARDSDQVQFRSKGFSTPSENGELWACTLDTLLSSKAVDGAVSGVSQWGRGWGSPGSVQLQLQSCSSGSDGSIQGSVLVHRHPLPSWIGVSPWAEVSGHSHLTLRVLVRIVKCKICAFLWHHWN